MSRLRAAAETRDEQDLRRVATALRRDVAERLRHGQSTKAIAAHLETLGMNAGDAKRFVAHIERRTHGRLRDTPMRAMGRGVALFASFGIIAVGVSVAGAIAVRTLSGSLGSVVGLNHLSDGDAALVAMIVGAVSGGIIAAIAKGLHTAAGILGALAGTAGGIWALAAGHFG